MKRHLECRNLNCVCDKMAGWPVEMIEGSGYWIHIHPSAPRVTKVEIPATEVRQPKKNTFDG